MNAWVILHGMAHVLWLPPITSLLYMAPRYVTPLTAPMLMGGCSVAPGSIPDGRTCRRM
jgi:hypothetical protein